VLGLLATIVLVALWVYVLARTIGMLRLAPAPSAT
jgi:hypothetical protein